MVEEDGQVDDGQELVEEQEPIAKPNPLEPGGPRFEQVYGKMKEYEKNINSYKEFGDPQSLKSKLDKLSQWEKAVEEQRKNAAMTDSDRTEAQRIAKLQKELRTVMPNLSLLDKIEAMEAKLAEQEGYSATTRAEATLKSHSQEFSKVLSAAKIDAKFQPKIEEYIVSQMSDDDRQRFISGDFSVAGEIFKQELKEGLFSTMSRGRSLPAPPVRHNAGGTPPDGKGSKKPMTMKEAEDAAWSRLSERE